MTKSRRKLKNTSRQIIMKTQPLKIYAVIRGKFIAIQAFLKHEENLKIDNLTHQLNELKKEQAKPEVSRRKEIVKI